MGMIWDKESSEALCRTPFEEEKLNDLVIKASEEVPLPNWLGVRFTNATETIIRAVKDKSIKKYTFNRGYAKSFGIGKIDANVWFLPISDKK
jgi:hypothetical protein